MYCKLVEDGMLIYIKKGTPAGAEIEISPAEYLMLENEMKYNAQKTEEYTMLVISGKMSVDDVPEKYRDEVFAKYEDVIISNYAKDVVAGNMTLNDVPLEYRDAVIDAVEFIKNIPEPNSYGISNELLMQIKDDTVTEVEEAVTNGTDE